MFQTINAFVCDLCGATGTEQEYIGNWRRHNNKHICPKCMERLLQPYILQPDYGIIIEERLKVEYSPASGDITLTYENGSNANVKLTRRGAKQLLGFLQERGF